MLDTITRRSVLAGAAALPAVAPRGARAQAANTIKVGVLTDLSGTFRDINGPMAVAATRLAAQEFAGRGFDVEVVSADHQNRPDVGVNIARQWFDRDGVDVVTSLAASSVALAVADLAREKNKVIIPTSTATSDLTGRACSPNTVHWVYDTYMLAKVSGLATVRAGGDSWFFITADYAFGHALERDTANFVRAAGGRVLGQARTPFPGTTDFSSFLLQAQASRAKVIGLAMAADDIVNCVKQAHEFGLTRRGQQLAGMIMFVQDIRGIGLESSQGMIMSEVFYHDLNDRTRGLAQRILRRTPDNMPSQLQAGTYSACLHYLKAVAEMGAARAKQSGLAVIEAMKRMPTDDDAFGPGRIRQDNRKLHPAYLFEVKSPAESRGLWDYYKLRATVPAEEAFRPMAEGGCPLVRG
jgi:branched-chain amino acid transport system substrate-binding protein